MPGAKKKRPIWIRYSGMGFEFAAAVVGLTLVGYWVGRRIGYERCGLLVGALLGVVGGGYNLIRESLAAVRRADGGNGEKDAGSEEP